MHSELIGASLGVNRMAQFDDVVLRWEGQGIYPRMIDAGAADHRQPTQGRRPFQRHFGHNTRVYLLYGARAPFSAPAERYGHR